MLGMSVGVTGIVTFANAYVTEIKDLNGQIYYLYALRAMLGFAQSFQGPATYSLITDFFPPEHRVKAFFGFSML